MTKYRLANLCNVTISHCRPPRRVVCYVYDNRRELVFHDLTSGAEVTHPFRDVVAATEDSRGEAIDHELLLDFVLEISKKLSRVGDLHLGRAVGLGEQLGVNRQADSL